MYSIKYDTQNIEFNIKRKSSLKNTYICIDADGVLVKTNNTTSIEDIRKMLIRKSAWISKKLDLFKSRGVNKNIRTDSRLYYMGKNYNVQMNTDKTTKTITINFTHSKFHITTPPKFTISRLKKEIGNFYKRKAIDKIIPLTKKWAKIMGVIPQDISFRYSKNRWGSCSSTDRISFNYHLIKLPLSLIEYVIVHELAHIVHHNHSKDFWKLVHKYLTDYKIKEEKIRVFEKLI